MAIASIYGESVTSDILIDVHQYLDRFRKLEGREPTVDEFMMDHIHGSSDELDQLIKVIYETAYRVSADYESKQRGQDFGPNGVQSYCLYDGDDRAIQSDGERIKMLVSTIVSSAVHSLFFAAR